MARQVNCRKISQCKASNTTYEHSIHGFNKVLSKKEIHLTTL